VWWPTIMLKATSLHQKIKCWCQVWWYPLALLNRQCLWRKNYANIPQEDVQHYTDVPCKLTAYFSILFIFSMTQHTIVSIISIKLLHQTKQWNLEMIFFHHICAKASKDWRRWSGLSSFRAWSSLGMYSFHFLCRKCNEHWFYRHQSHENTDLCTSSEIVWRPLTLLHFYCHLNCRVLQTVLYSLFALFHLPQTYHTILQWLHVLVVLQINFSKMFTFHSHL
jgi:hypothetical protein